VPARTAATYIFTALTCTTTTITLEPTLCISYPDLRKFPYFADTTERGDRGRKAEEIGGETEGDF
jgi:hypothetical protein